MPAYRLPGHLLLFLLLPCLVVPVCAQSTFTLQKALQTARANNPVLKTEQFNVKVSEADIVSARMRPNLSLNNQSLFLAKPSLYPNNTRWNDAQNRQIWWQLTKPFQLPMQRRYKIQYAEQGVALTQQLYYETERNLFQDVATQWLDVWTAKKQLNILQIAKSNVDTLVSINKLRLKNQIITQTDLARTEILANQYDLQIRTAEQIYRNEIMQLKFVLGTQDSISIDTTSSFSFVFASSMDSMMQHALEDRSDIRSIKSTIDVANANIRLQKAMVWPQPELGAIYNPQNNIPYWGFYGTIEIPIFSRNQGEIRKSAALKEQAEQNLLSTKQQIRTELQTAYNTYLVQKQNLERFNSILKQSEDILNNVKYAYLRGGTTIIDYLEAQRSWLDTQQHYYETLQEYSKSYVRLLYASGLINQIAR